MENFLKVTPTPLCNMNKGIYRVHIHAARPVMVTPHYNTNVIVVEFINEIYKGLCISVLERYHSLYRILNRHVDEEVDIFLNVYLDEEYHIPQINMTIVD